MSYHTGNRFLDTLSPALRSSIVTASRHVKLPAKALLCQGDVQPKHLYLLADGVASVVVSVRNGTSVEVGMTGSEGLVGFSSLLGPSAPLTESFMLIAGSGWSLPIKVAQRLFREDEEFRTRVLEYLQVQMAICSQNAACNKLHEAEPRLARWLLTAADLSGRETLQHLTQESLSRKLGMQRTTVVLAEGHLQQTGLISHTRGTVRIVDRQGLGRVACGCYQVTKELLSSLLSTEIEPSRFDMVAGSGSENRLGQAA